MQDQQLPPRPKSTPDQIQRAMALFQPPQVNPRIERLKFLSQELERSHQTLRCAWDHNMSDAYDFCKRVKDLLDEFIEATRELSSANG